MTVLMRAGCSLFLCCAIAGCTRHSAADDEGEGSSAPAVVSVGTVLAARNRSVLGPHSAAQSLTVHPQ